MFYYRIDDGSGAIDLFDQWLQSFPITYYVQAVDGTRNGRTLIEEEKSDEWREAADIIGCGAIFMSFGITDSSGGMAVSIKPTGNNKMANKISKQLGYEGVEALKKILLGKRELIFT